MSRTVVVEAKSVDDAVQKASDQFGITPESLKHDVISYGASGIFGLVGFKKAKIKVYLPKEKQKADAVSGEAAETETNLPPAEDNESSNALFDEKDDIDGKEDFAPNEEDVEAVVRFGRELLTTIINRITEDTRIETAVEKRNITLRVMGGNAGMLIGKKGQTLEAIQYIVEKAVNKKAVQRYHVLVDIEDYMENKISRLEVMARKTADKVKKTGKPVSVGQMNSQDRKIIHIALKNDPDVRTQSMGDGYYRKLVVFPKSFSRNKKRIPRKPSENRK